MVNLDQSPERRPRSRRTKGQIKKTRSSRDRDQRKGTLLILIPRAISYNMKREREKLFSNFVLPQKPFLALFCLLIGQINSNRERKRERDRLGLTSALFSSERARHSERKRSLESDRIEIYCLTHSFESSLNTYQTDSASKDTLATKRLRVAIAEFASPAFVVVVAAAAVVAARLLMLTLHLLLLHTVLLPPPHLCCHFHANCEQVPLSVSPSSCYYSRANRHHLLVDCQ